MRLPGRGAWATAAGPALPPGGAHSARRLPRGRAGQPWPLTPRCAAHAPRGPKHPGASPEQPARLSEGESRTPRARRRPGRGSRGLVFPPPPSAETRLWLEKVACAPGTGTCPGRGGARPRPQGVPSSLRRTGARSPVRGAAPKGEARPPGAPPREGPAETPPGPGPADTGSCGKGVGPAPRPSSPAPSPAAGSVSPPRGARTR